MNVRAKFTVTGKDMHPTAGPGDPHAVVSMRPVYNDAPENEVWSKATPSGVIQMTITNPTAFGVFEVGKEYFVDFSPAE